jgi:hypothetical protein
MRYVILIVKSVILHTSAIANLKRGTSPLHSIISEKLEFVGMKEKYFTLVTKPKRNLQRYGKAQKEKNNCILGRLTYNISHRFYKCA